MDAKSGESRSGASAGHTPGSHDAAIGVMLEGRTQARYDAVVAALVRVETSAYGICVACAKPIPFGRLLVMPEATQCVRCGVHE
jgi:RNA polymerase-binding transcription factor DksA